MSREITPALILDEYAAALRGDWSLIDGRTEQAALWNLSAQIRATGNRPLGEDDARGLRIAIGICPDGLSHWLDQCVLDECGKATS